MLQGVHRDEADNYAETHPDLGLPPDKWTNHSPRRLSHLVQMRKYCEGLSQDNKANCTGKLITELANWAVASSQMQDVIKLPLDSLQEQASFLPGDDIGWFAIICKQL